MSIIITDSIKFFEKIKIFVSKRSIKKTTTHRCSTNYLSLQLNKLKNYHYTFRNLYIFKTSFKISIDYIIILTLYKKGILTECLFYMKARLENE